MSDVATRMRALRERLGKTQEEFAAGAQIAQGHYSKIENGMNKASTVRIRESLARGAGVPVSKFGDYLDGKIELDELLRADLASGPAAVASPPNVDDSGMRARLEAELFRAMDPTKFDAEDFDGTRRAFREIAFLVVEGSDLSAMAREWLNAARQLRIEGLPVTTATIATRAASGRGQRAAEIAAEIDARHESDADEELRASKKRKR